MRGKAIGTFGAIHLAMEQLIDSMPEGAVLALKEDCDALTRGNCPFYEYRAAQWIRPHVEGRLRALDRARRVAALPDSRSVGGDRG